MQLKVRKDGSESRSYVMVNIYQISLNAYNQALMIHPGDQPTKNLAFIAMIVAFDAILSLLSALLPLGAIFVMLIAPLGAAAVSLFCKKRYIGIYLVAAIGICIAVTAWDIMTVLFYMIPALITGSCYGLLWKLKAPVTVNIFALTILASVFFYLSILLIRGLLGVDMVEFLLALIKRSNDGLSQAIFPLFVLGYSFAQVGLMHAFASYQLQRLSIEIVVSPRFDSWAPAITVALAIASFVCGFFYAKAAYFLFGCALYWMLCSLVLFAPKIKPITIAALVFGLFGSVIIFAAAYKLMPGNSGLLLLLVPCVWVAGSASLNHVLVVHEKPKAE